MKTSKITRRTVFETIFLIGLIIVIATSFNKADIIMTKGNRLDLSILTDENPAIREKSIESADYAIVTVTGIEGHDDCFTVTAKFPDYPDVLCHIYLNTNDIRQLNVGDSIAVAGHIKYYPANGIHKSDYIVIGNAVSGKPLFNGDAKLLKIIETHTN